MIRECSNCGELSEIGIDLEIAGFSQYLCINCACSEDEEMMDYYVSEVIDYLSGVEEEREERIRDLLQEYVQMKIKNEVIKMLQNG